MGALAAYLGNSGFQFGYVVFIGTIIFLFLLVSYAYSAFYRNQLGITSEFAALIVFFL